jgi:hypothetical protein
LHKFVSARNACFSLIKAQLLFRSPPTCHPFQWFKISPSVCLLIRFPSQNQRNHSYSKLERLIYD